LHVKTHKKAAASLLMSDTKVMSVQEGSTNTHIQQIFTQIEETLKD
jgi:hypothetical protein